VVGCFYSIDTGISHDEFKEKKNCDYNVALFKNFFLNIDLDQSLINYPDKFYGIGFQIISQPIQLLFEDIIFNYKAINKHGSHLVAKHLVVFLSFAISGIFVYFILINIINNKFFVGIVSILYLLYPYLLGHGLFNPKDIPFLLFWIVCTYFSIKLFTNLNNSYQISYNSIFVISILTALLLSIRISGLLIFTQYIFTFFLYINLKKINLLHFIKINFKKILAFLIFLLLFTYSLNPVYWKNPLLIIEAVNSMSKHFNDVCTLTLGKCMFSKNLPPTYIPIWLSVKLPFIILIGLFLIPFTERKLFTNFKTNLFLGTLLFSSFFIPIILIITGVHLYDELRQILFIFPIFFIIGAVSLHAFSKNFFYFLSLITLSIFLFENVKIYPYQYAWFNVPSRIMNLSKNFEVDYWGLSGKELAESISYNNDKEFSKACILVSPSWSVKPYLNSDIFKCFGPWSAVDSDITRPFWAVQNVRNLKKGKIFKCSVSYESKFNLLFTSNNFITGRVLKCT
jgi:hypothetical protein